MKLKTILLAFCTILVAFGGAYAMKAVNTVDPTLVYYWLDENDKSNPNTCVTTVIEVEPCEVNLTPTCDIFIDDVEDVRFIYSDFDEELGCIDPYERP